ncbi:MAG: right-handed parallel beta-helix repeat-containing protein, partial [Planctomycetota bacterium]|nr:right-handed parallel beta-helix repeat-containing protein [Planctomycetota bacterium]
MGSSAVQTLRRTIARTKRAARSQRSSGAHSLEALEPRQLMSVAMSTDGWTDIAASADSRLIYVSSSTGNDANTGLSQASPVRTIAAAVAKARNGFPDWVLLKKGDTFNESISWSRSGRNAQEPTVLGAYGTGARPIITPPSGQDGISVISGASMHDIAIIGLDFYAMTRDPSVAGANTVPIPNGIRWVAPGSNLLIEDSAFRFFNDGLVIQGPDPVTSTLNNFTIRRSVVTDSYGTSGHSEGIYLSGVLGITIQENLFDHNGWNASVVGAEKNVFNHNIYLDNENYSDNNLITGNILARASSHGVQDRAGGTVSDNFIFDNPLGMLIGGGQDFSSSAPNGILGYASNNVVLQSGDITSALPRGFGFDLVNIRLGVVSNNIIAHDRSATNSGHGFSIDAPTTGLALNNNIVYDWHTPVLLGSGISITQSGNYYGAYGAANTPGYVDPNRDAASYNATLGGAATQDAFLTAARNQSRANWNPALMAVAANAYVRAGFATSTADTTAPTAAASVSNVTAAGATSYTFTVTFSDNAGINVSTLDGSDVRVTGPNGFSQLAALVSVNVNSNGTPRTATYSIAAPGGAWSVGANGTYSVALVAGQVADTSGNTAAASTLATFTATIGTPDTAPPTASVTAANVSAAGATSYTFTVTYSDNI